MYTFTGHYLSRFSLLLLFFLISACQTKDKVEPFNVLLVTFDTTRADHIGVYGNPNAHTPVLDALAKDSVLYEQAVTHIPITLPSHSSMMTGKVPFTHGVRDNGLFTLSAEQLTLAEILKQHDYNTAASIGSFPLSSQFGINQGFDYYNEHITQKYEDIHGDRTIPKDRLFFDERTAAQVNDGLMPWIEDNHQKPFFTWLHYFDPHHPHEPPAPYNQSFIHDLYLGEIAYSDESLGSVINQLKRLGVYDNTMIIFTSDHGEGNGEHNESTHSLLIYNATQHVPLIVKYPNQQFAGTRIKNWVGLVDILPTVLSHLNIAPPEDIQGHVLATNNEQNNPDRELYLETLSPRFSRGWGEQRGIIKNNFKYIYGPQKELYNLTDDPREVKNILDDNLGLAQEFKQDLQDYLDEYQVTGLNASKSISAETLNTLRGLGYIQSTGNAVETFEEKLNDAGDAPQLHVSTISTYSETKNLLFQGKYIQAIQLLDGLLASDPANLAYLELKIQADIKLGNLSTAKESLENLPDDSYGTLTAPNRLSLLAKIALIEGDMLLAKNYFADAENLQQTEAGQYQLAKLYQAEQNNEKQRKHLINVLKFNSSNVEALNDLAINFALNNEIVEAEENFINAIEAHPYHQLSHYNYGTFLYSMADLESANKQFKRAIELQKNYIKAHYALIETHVALGQIMDAESALQELAELAPNSPLYLSAKELFTNP